MPGNLCGREGISAGGEDEVYLAVARTRTGAPVAGVAMLIYSGTGDEFESELLVKRPFALLSHRGSIAHFGEIAYELRNGSRARARSFSCPA